MCLLQVVAIASHLSQQSAAVLGRATHPSPTSCSSQTWLPLRRTSNSTRLHVLCAVYYPPCFSAQDGTTHKVLPCFELCEYVRCGCDAAVEALGAVWPQEFNCSNFPTSHQGELCYPGDVTIQVFQEEPTLSALERDSRPDPQKCGNTHGASTVSPGDDGTHGGGPLDCSAAALSAPNTTGYSSYSLVGVHGCGLPCNPSLLVPGHRPAVVISLTTLSSAIDLLTLMFTLATVSIGLERFPYPQQPFALMALTHCTMTAIHLTTGMQLLGSGAPACDTSPPALAFTAQGLPLRLGQSPTVRSLSVQ